MIEVKVQKSALSLDTCVSKTAKPANGGTVVFIGTARDLTDGRKVLKLDFEAYKAMALNEMKKIALEATELWAVNDIVIHHRDGTVETGEAAVIIVAAAERRDAAFRACRYCIDKLKETVPIWKKEVFEDGAEWVSPHP
jgi:molybdopterin synthase catalytic subunit